MKEDAFDRFDRLIAAVQPTDQAAVQRAVERQATLTKPPGSLGRLEQLSLRLAGIFGSERPDPRGVAVILAAADLGVAAQGVSAYPAEVTAAMVRNLLPTESGPGGAAICAMAEQFGARLYPMDAGVRAELPLHPALVRAAVRRGTDDLSLGPAMAVGEALALLLAGAELAQRAGAEGAGLLVPAELGIGNTTSASALTARCLHLPVRQVTGRGTGIDDLTLLRKREVVQRALDRRGPEPLSPLETLADLGGFEIAAMVGVILQGAALRLGVIVDGFVEGAAALIARELRPEVSGYLLPAGLCAEIGHRAQLDALGLEPLFELGLRLGEGTGGLLAAQIHLAAAATLRGMRTFAEAAVPEA